MGKTTLIVRIIFSSWPSGEYVYRLKNKGFRITAPNHRFSLATKYNQQGKLKWEEAEMQKPERTSDPVLLTQATKTIVLVANNKGVVKENVYPYQEELKIF